MSLLFFKVKICITGYQVQYVQLECLPPPHPNASYKCSQKARKALLFLDAPESGGAGREVQLQM